MNRISFRVALFVFFAMTLAPLTFAETLYRNDAFGFSIQAPVPAKTDLSAPYQMVTMTLPAENGFSANVNVQAQPFTGSPKEYLETSKAGLASMGLKAVAEKVEKDLAQVEYIGEMQGFKLHWYAKAFFQKDRVILVTATCLEENWETTKALLIASVDSFKSL